MPEDGAARDETQRLQACASTISEGRALDRSASDGARKVATLVADATQSVDRGVATVDRTVGSLIGIPDGTHGVEGQIAWIARTFGKTRASIGRISWSTAVPDRTTRRMTATPEDASAAVQTLDREARNLSPAAAAIERQPEASFTEDEA